MSSKFGVGIIVGALLIIMFVVAVAATEVPPDIDRVCMCTKAGACHWVVFGAAATGLTEYPDWYCTGGVEPTATWMAPTKLPPDPDPEATLEPLDGLQSAYSVMTYDLCSIDECSARETISAGIATLAAKP